MSDPYDAVFNDWIRETRQRADATAAPRYTPPVQRTVKAMPARGASSHEVKQPSAARQIAGLVASIAPGTGEAMSAVDAVKDAKKGNWGSAALSAAGAIPVVGKLAKGAKEAKALKRLFRVEPKVLPDPGAPDWLEKALKPDEFAKYKSEQGRLFADDLGQLDNYGHGEPDRVTYFIDVPEDIAEQAKRLHHEGKFHEYLLPPELVAKKTPFTKSRKEK